MKINEIITYLDSVFHPEYQEDYDNSGFLIGDDRRECTGVLVALDLTPAVADEAVRKGLNLIVTHHPVIFGGLKRINNRNEAGRTISQLIENKISVYAAHTNLDNLPHGVNGILAEKLGLDTREARVLRPLPGMHEVGAGLVVATHTPISAEQFLQHCKEVLCLPFIRCSEPPDNRPVQRVALCGGAGSFLIGDAIAAQADLYLTSDLKYHDFQRPEGRLLMADIGHYESEQFAKEIISRTISEKFRNFACQIAESQQGIVCYI